MGILEHNVFLLYFNEKALLVHDFPLLFADHHMESVRESYIEGVNEVRIMENSIATSVERR